MTTYFVYMLRCHDGTLYTGVTTDIERRVDEHNRGIASKYTRVRRPVEVVYKEEAGSRSLAQKREAAIKKLTRSEKLSLIITSICMLFCLSACSPRHPVSTSYLVTKAPYPVPRVDHQYEVPPEDCKPVHIEGLIRHGSRYLADSRKIEKLARIMRRARSKSRLTTEGREMLEAVEATLKSFRPGQLTHQGKSEQFELGKRTAKRFLSLFEHNNVVELTSAPKERIRESREYFRNGLAFVLPIRATMLDGDVKVLRYFDYCQAYVAYKSSLASSLRSAARPDGGNFNRLFTKLRKKDTPKIVEGVYALCQLDYNLQQANAEHGFCSLLTKEQKDQVFKQNNTKTFNRLGPVAGNGMSCVVIEPMFERMQKIVNGESIAAANFSFAHAETVVPVSGFFELFEAHTWKAAEAGPMAVNFQLVTYACPKRYKVKLLYNEKEHYFNVPGCRDSYYCDFERVKAYYEKRKAELGMKSCSSTDWEKYCQNSGN